MRIVFMGTPDFAVPSLEHLILNGHEIAAVYTQPDKPAGRGRSVTVSPVKKAALAHNLTVVQPVSLKQPDAIAQLAEVKPDMIVITAYGQILPQAVLDIPCDGCINVHFSLLPRHRGASPVASAILAGDRFSGVTIMLVTLRLDTGPVLSRAAVAISPQDTTGSLTAKLSQVAARFLQEVLVRWGRGEITPQSQNEAEATYFASITKEAGEIDWHLPAVDIWRRVRAYNPWPGCYTRWQGKKLDIIEAIPISETTDSEVGKVVSLAGDVESKAAFGISTGQGVLGVLKVQLEGKQAMPAAEFLRGQRHFVGSVLPG